MKNKYPHYKYYSTTKQVWPSLFRCDVCKDRFSKYEKIIVQEVIISSTHGDKRVSAYCVKHDPRKETK